MTDTRTVRVEVSPAYDVRVAPGLVAHVSDHVVEDRVAVISDETVFGLHGRALVDSLERSGKDVTVASFPAGESSKDISTYGRLLRSLAEVGLGRDSAVVALGGGVAGDLAGFVAATYLRGVAYYQVPTTLLAMVDSSVGGKTGVDLPEGKNLVGAFWQPRAVFADVAVLVTLPARELRQGTAELLKTGLIGDSFLVGFAEDELVPAVTGSGMPGEAALADAVARCVAVKAGIVAADERESGVRAHLNLGHTLGHAIEAASGLDLPHGDAVLYGLVYAAILGRERGMVDLVDHLARLLAGLRPEPFPALRFEEVVPFLMRDKKSLGGRPRFVLLEELGRPVVVPDVSESEMTAAWSTLEEMMR